MHSKDLLTTVTTHYSTLLEFSFVWMRRASRTIRGFSNTQGGLFSRSLCLDMPGNIWLDILED
jgi:hypothetical protein